MPFRKQDSQVFKACTTKNILNYLLRIISYFRSCAMSFHVFNAVGINSAFYINLSAANFLHFTRRESYPLRFIAITVRPTVYDCPIVSFGVFQFLKENATCSFCSNVTISLNKRRNKLSFFR